MAFSIGKNVLDGDDKLHVVIDDVGPTLKRIGQQYEEKQKTIKELREQLNNFKANVYKDQEMKRMKQSFDQMESNYYRGFPITKEEQQRINTWLINHENTHHDGYPCYHGVSGGGYSYNFYPTAIGISGYITCESCRRKANENAAGDIKKYKDLLKQYDANFCFQDIC